MKTNGTQVLIAHHLLQLHMDQSYTLSVLCIFLPDTAEVYMQDYMSQ